MIDRTHPDFGISIDVFLNTYGDDLAKVFTDNKEYREVRDGVTVFCEFFGPNSFAGWHDPNDQKEVVLFDVNINKRGFVLPKDFIRNFGHLKIPSVVYEGNFGPQFISDVQEGKIPGLKEGVVVKGINSQARNKQHGLWLSKVKTRWWLEELKRWAMEYPERFKRALEDNIREQS